MSNIEDTSLLVWNALRAEKRVLFEGAQGTLLDLDHGTYPYVTSSNPVAGYACVGSGIGPVELGQVWGVTTAYLTRVGAGPFPTELHDETGEMMCEVGHEYGTTTGRKRRCGWLDLVALRYAARVNGLTGLAITKLDVLNDLETIKICTSYRCGDQTFEELPLTQALFAQAEPVYEDLQGWKSDISGATRVNDLPLEAIVYLNFIARHVLFPSR